MRIGTLQFAPRLGKVEYNIRRADELLSTAMKRIGKDDRRPLDLLVLPEMAFSGWFISVSPCHSIVFLLYISSPSGNPGLTDG
jgi:predicted amidohydrolase